MDKSGSKTSTKSKIISGSGSTQVRITTQQLQILQLIYKFRFISTKHVQVLLARRQIQQAQQRLNLLLSKGYIGRNFSNTDRLTGQYASYFLLPAGMKVLKQNKDQLDRKPEQQVFHNIYKDKTASPRFIKHQLELGGMLLELERIHQTFHYLTKSGLTIYDSLPEQLPDAFVYLKDKTKEKSKRTNYFLEYWEDSVPFWVYRNRIKAYEEYSDEDTWKDKTGDEMPIILLICESSTLQRRTERFLKRYMENCYEDMTFYITSTATLKSCMDPKYKIWREIGYTELDGVEHRYLH